jgi:hypothetical protein
MWCGGRAALISVVQSLFLAHLIALRHVILHMRCGDSHDGAEAMPRSHRDRRVYVFEAVIVCELDAVFELCTH